MLLILLAQFCAKPEAGAWWTQPSGSTGGRVGLTAATALDLLPGHPIEEALLGRPLHLPRNMLGLYGLSPISGPPGRACSGRTILDQFSGIIP